MKTISKILMLVGSLMLSGSLMALDDEIPVGPAPFSCTSLFNCADSCCVTNLAACSGTATGCKAGCATYCTCSNRFGVQQCQGN